MSDWSKDIDLETIKEYLRECAENDDYHYEQYQVDIVMHEYIRQKQVIETLINENERLNNIINELEKYLIEYFKKEYPDRKLEDYNLEYCTYDYALVILGKLQELKGSDING